MPTPVYRRFRNQTLLLDQAAPLPVLNVGMLLTNEPVTDTTIRHISVTADDWTDTVTEATHPIAYEWLSAYFGQELKPETAVLIYYDDTPTTGDADPSAALQDADDKLAEWYFGCYFDNADTAIASQTNFAQWIQAQPVERQGMLLTNDTNAYVVGTGTDIGSQIRGLSYSRTSVIFHPTGTVNEKDLTKNRPDAAIVGRMMPTYPETGGIFEQWDYKTIAGSFDSGLSAAQQTALVDKGYNFVETFANTAFTHVFKGRSCTGREIRLQWAADWFDANVQASLANYAFRNPLMAFDQETFSDVEAIYLDWGQRTIDRRVLTNFTVNMPDPDTIPASVRVTGKASLNDLYLGTLNSAIDEWSVTGKWVLGGV
ncbi:tail sheath protein [Vibrio phage 13VT501A]|nr:tail sheath protein [Vibrio phage 13VT501A]